MPLSRNRQRVARSLSFGAWAGLGVVLGLGLVPTKLEAAPVLHQQLPSPQLKCEGGLCRQEGDTKERLPQAAFGSNGLIGAPDANRTPESNEQIFSGANTSKNAQSGGQVPGSDPPPTRRLRALPDANTGAEPPGERVYHEVFNPAVFPYKRMTVLDAVDDEGALYLADPRRTELSPDGSQVGSARDPFYGSLIVDFQAGEATAIPSPAANLHLLSYRTTPLLPLRFSVDGGENLYVTAYRSGRYRLVYLVDAPQRYFAGPLFSSHKGPRPRLQDLPAIPALPRKWRREAHDVLRHIGIRTSGDGDYETVLNRLVGYFRDFQIAPLPEESRSLYQRIAFSQRGVCRHRSYAFLITALALGIPARYVENELHVFVEVYIPDAAGGYYRRINLGGAPLEQRIQGGESKVAYEEKGGDPFERPPSFSRGRAPSVSGLPQRAERRGGPGSGGPGGADSDGLPALDGPEDRGKRGQRKVDPNQKSGEKTAGNGQGPASSTSPGDASKPDGSGKKASSGGRDNPKLGSSGPIDPSKPGNASLSGKNPGSADGEGAEAQPEPEREPEVDNTAAPEDPRRAATELVSTQITVAIERSARKVYRGAAVRVYGTVSASRGSAQGLDVLLILAVPGSAEVLGRTKTNPDGTYETEVEIPAHIPLGNYPLVARVRGDDKRRGSSSGRYPQLSDSN